MLLTIWNQVLLFLAESSFDFIKRHLNSRYKLVNNEITSWDKQKQTRIHFIFSNLSFLAQYEFNHQTGTVQGQQNAQTLLLFWSSKANLLFFFFLTIKNKIYIVWSLFNHGAFLFFIQLVKWLLCKIIMSNSQSLFDDIQGNFFLKEQWHVMK
jgi:hypothetical protein